MDHTTICINGELKPGDIVLSAPIGIYHYCVGTVLAIDKAESAELGTGAHDQVDIVHVNFEDSNYSEKRKQEIAEIFRKLYAKPMAFAECRLADVHMHPNTLIRITGIGNVLMETILNSREAAEALCALVMKEPHTAHNDRQNDIKEQPAQKTFAFERKPLSVHDLPPQPMGNRGYTPIVQRIVELPEQDYAMFKGNLLDDYEFIASDAENTLLHRDGSCTCLLVRAPNQQEGILVCAEGYSHARYAAYVSDYAVLNLKDVPVKEVVLTQPAEHIADYDHTYSQFRQRLDADFDAWQAEVSGLDKHDTSARAKDIYWMPMLYEQLGLLYNSFAPHFQAQLAAQEHPLHMMYDIFTKLDAVGDHVYTDEAIFSCFTATEGLNILDNPTDHPALKLENTYEMSRPETGEKGR